MEIILPLCLRAYFKSITTILEGLNRFKTIGFYSKAIL
jgi:hypothetical protein